MNFYGACAQISKKIISVHHISVYVSDTWWLFDIYFDKRGIQFIDG